MGWGGGIFKSVKKVASKVGDGISKLGSKIDDKILQPMSQVALAPMTWPLALMGGMPDMGQGGQQESATGTTSLEGVKSASKLNNRKRSLFSTPAGGTTGPLGMMIRPTMGTKSLLGQ